jgi:hypothetical protein
VKWPLLLLASVLGCAGERPPAQPVFAEMPRTATLHFRYELADGKGVLFSEALAGRKTLIAFVTTYDLASQAEARILSHLIRAHTPRINAAAIVLEPPENRMLVVAFRDGLRLDYPVAMGDAALIAGEGPFGDVATEEELERALRGL